MWFKNVRAYRLTSPFDLSPGAAGQRNSSGARLSNPARVRRPSGDGLGTAAGVRKVRTLVHAARWASPGHHVRREEKLLPATVVREQLLRKRSPAIESEQERKVYRKERLNLKDEIVQDCLPRAFSRSSRVFIAYIDVRANWIFVDSASAARAEEVAQSVA